MNKKIYDEFGDTLGKLKDIYISTERGYPISIGYKVLRDGEDFYYEFRQIKFYKYRRSIIIKVSGVFNIIPKSYKYRLSKEILNKQIIDINGKKVVKIIDVHMASIGNELRVVAIESGVTTFLRKYNIKYVPKFIKKFINKMFKNLEDTVIKWEDMESIQFIENGLLISVPQSKLCKMHPADIVEILEDLDDNNRKKLFESFNDNLASEILEEMEDLDMRIDIIKNLSDSKVISILNYIPNYELVDILEKVDESLKERILINLEKSDIDDIKNIMSYDENKVGSIMNTEFISFNINLKLGEIIDIVKSTNVREQYLYNIYILDENNILKGVVDFRSLIFLDRNINVFEIMDKEFISVYDDDDLESVIGVFLKYNLITIPVIHRCGKLMGSLFIHDILTKEFLRI
nr:CBS domain-containing protein [Candidatus Arthromitus sp. SFB-rat-Yit]